MSKQKTFDAVNCVGDGKLPNKYWVTSSNDYSIREGNTLLNASEFKGFEATATTQGPFDTYGEALAVVKKADANSVYIEDRLSGELLHIARVECCNCEHVDYSRIEDTDFTEKTLKKAGLKFV